MDEEIELNSRKKRGIWTAAFGLAVMTGLSASNYLNHEGNSYQTLFGEEAYEKADPFGHTRVIVSSTGRIKITKFSLLTYDTFIDQDGDGVVDLVLEGKRINEHKVADRTYVRKHHWKNYSDFFIEADETFALEKERFKDLIE